MPPETVSRLNLVRRHTPFIVCEVWPGGSWGNSHNFVADVAYGEQRGNMESRRWGRYDILSYREMLRYRLAECKPSLYFEQESIDAHSAILLKTYELRQFCRVPSLDLYRKVRL